MIRQSLFIWRTLRQSLVTTPRKIPLTIFLLRNAFMLRIIESRLGSLVLSPAYRGRKLQSYLRRTTGAILKYVFGMNGSEIKSLPRGFYELRLVESVYLLQPEPSCSLLAEFQTMPGKMLL